MEPAKKVALVEYKNKGVEVSGGRWTSERRVDIVELSVTLPAGREDVSKVGAGAESGELARLVQLSRDCRDCSCDGKESERKSLDHFWRMNMKREGR